MSNTKFIEKLEFEIQKLLNLFEDYQNSHQFQGSSEGQWSANEIVGHLIDSALNNIQRFIRLQTGDLHGFPGYNQDAWVEIQKYDTQPWNELVTLWSAYNKQIKTILLNLDDHSLNNVWVIGEARLSLQFLIVDYCDHLSTHAKQLEGITKID